MLSKNRLSLGMLDDSLEYVKHQKNVEKTHIEELNLNKIIQVDFPTNQYYKKQTKKKQIVLHHTVSGRGALGDISWWKQTKARISTHIIIDWRGDLYQCYSSKYWSHHLGVKAKNNVALNKGSIGVEIDSWGGLVRYNRHWYPAIWDGKLKRYVANTKIEPVENVQVYSKPFRGFHAYQKYTVAQILALEKLLIYWHSIYKIPLNYDESMWDVNKNALTGKPGVWTHVSYRKDKSDCHPQPELINMLKSLKT